MFFLNEGIRKYLVLFLNKLLGYDYEDLNSNMILSNIEMPFNIKGKSSYSDLVCKYRNKNNYGENNETILINIDNYDVLKKKRFIYESKIRFKAYNMCIYKNIKIIHINLVYLRWKYYNKFELNEIEKILLIFVCQKKDEIRKVIKREEIEDIMNMIDRLKFEEHNGIVTYDREEFEKILKEEFEENKRRLEKSKIKFEEKQNQFKKQQNQFEEKQNQFNNERIAFAKELKNIGTPIEKIIKITNLTLEQVNMI